MSGPAPIKTLEDRHLAFMEFLLSEEYVVHKTPIKTYAERSGHSTRTLFYWKSDPTFVKEWEKRVYGEHRAPEKVDRLLDVLYKKGLEGDVKAIQLHMQLMDRMTPTNININKDGDKPLSAYTDDELAAMIAAEAKQALEQRGNTG